MVRFDLVFFDRLSHMMLSLQIHRVNDIDDQKNIQAQQSDILRFQILYGTGKDKDEG
jgi:hypothetical protein